MVDVGTNHSSKYGTYMSDHPLIHLQWQAFSNSVRIRIWVCVTRPSPYVGKDVSMRLVIELINLYTYLEFVEAYQRV